MRPSMLAIGRLVVCKPILDHYFSNACLENTSCESIGQVCFSHENPSWVALIITRLVKQQV
jgi:hypothetical protein